MIDDETDEENSGGRPLPRCIDAFAYKIEEYLQEAESDGLDRDRVADLLERLAGEVRDGHTQLPEHRGEWWNETHGGSEA